MQHFAERATELGLTLSSEQCLRFEQYAAALAEWNERFNLTTITEPAQVETHHFLDSLSALPVLAAVQSLKLPALLASTPTAIDVGTGAGLPGLALKLVWPGLQLTLLEGTGKKVTFLEHMIQLYGLSGVRAVHGRAEELAGHAPWREGFDLVLARAVDEPGLSDGWRVPSRPCRSYSSTCCPWRASAVGFSPTRAPCRRLMPSWPPAAMPSPNWAGN